VEEEVAMPMLISHKHHFILIHIPKTGGNSIYGALADVNDLDNRRLPSYFDGLLNWQEYYDNATMGPLRPGELELIEGQKYMIRRTLAGGHGRIIDLERLVPWEYLKGYRIYCVARNPFDRWVSWWMYQPMKQWLEVHPDGWTKGQVKQAQQSLDDFMRLLDEIWADKKSPYDPDLERRAYGQVEYFSTSFGLRVNFLRFDKLDQDFNRMCREVGIPERALPVSNNTREPPSVRDHQAFRKYYTNWSRQWVMDKYGAEFELLRGRVNVD
jgi:hypothetical protein